MLTKTLINLGNLARVFTQNSWSRLFSISVSNVSGQSDEAIQDISKSLQLHMDFISEKEENDLLVEISPLFRRLRYQQDHWDSAIVGYRETEYARWNPQNRVIINRILQTSGFNSDNPPLQFVHVLDLEATGYIKPHVDSVRYCGAIIAGVSLLSNAIMRFVHTADPDKICDVYINRRSLYVMSGVSRYDYTHEILPTKALFQGTPVEKPRRIAVICRSKP